MNNFSRALLSLAVLICLLVPILWMYPNFGADTKTRAQTSCNGPWEFNPPMDKWPKYAMVSVFYRQGDFTETQRKFEMEPRFEDWEKHRFHNCSYVTFGGYTVTPTQPAMGGGNKIWVSKRTGGSTQQTTMAADGTGFQHIFIGTDSLTTLRETTAHETGHGFGLENCSSCGQRTSVMGPLIYSNFYTVTNCDCGGYGNVIGVYRIYCCNPTDQEIESCYGRGGEWNPDMCCCDFPPR